MSQRTDYLLELIAGEYQKQLLVGTAAQTSLTNVVGIVFRETDATFAVLKVEGVDALAGIFGDLDNSEVMYITDGVLFAGKDKHFTDITLTNATDSVWLITTKDA